MDDKIKTNDKTLPYDSISSGQNIPVDDKHNLLTIASLFEEGFSIDWILELTGIKASTCLMVVDRAIETGILSKSGSGIYCFIDQDLRKKLKTTLPSHQVDDLQHNIVKLYLQETPNDNTITHQIADYFLHTSNELEGYQWLFKAGLFYKRKFKRNRARCCFEKITKDLKRFQSEEADMLFVKAAIEYSKSVDYSEQVKNAYPALKEALIRAKKMEDLVSRATIEMHLSNVNWFRGQQTKSYRHYERACALAISIKDQNWQRTFSIFKVMESFVWGKYKEALVDYEKFIPDVAKYPRYWFSFKGAIYLGMCLAYTGQITQGLGMVHSIRNHCRKMGNLSVACEAGVQLANVLIDIRQVEKAIYYINETLQDAAVIQNDLYKASLLYQLAYCNYLKKDYESSVSVLRERLKIQGDVLNKQPIYPFDLELAWAMDQKKFPQVEDFNLPKLIQKHIRVLNIAVKGFAFRYKALTEMREGLPSAQILDSLFQSQKWLEESGHKTELARTRLNISQHYRAVGEKEKAEKMEALAKEDLGSIEIDLIPDDLRVFNNTPRSEKDILKEILKLSREIASIRDAKELLHQIVFTANRITGAERGAIFLLDKKDKASIPQLRASRTLTDQDIAEPEFERSLALIKKTATTGTGCVRVFDEDQNEGALIHSRIHSCICVPMVTRDKVVGVMYHDNSLLASNFKETDLEILSHFAAQAAIAIDNAQAYAEVQRLNQTLKEEKEYYKEKDLENVHFDEIVGKSQAIIKVLSNVKRVADTDTTILILGETGVGKELVARAIHIQSSRKKKAFIRVHCSALPESLISSELFGHEKGAFTGASERRIGRFELADNGTIFLDEIGELPLEIQVHLLRILQTGEFERVGGSKTIKSNFRLILATNRDLEREVREKRFRLDLYYRINVFPIIVPPLRERKEDIPLLASYFLNLYGRLLNKPLYNIRQKDVEKLMRYDWPGNVRELENVIERAIILSSGSKLTLPDIQSKTYSATENLREGQLPSLKENERRLIVAALSQTRGKVQGKGGAAELLEINPHTLKSRMRKLGITRDQITG